VWSKWLSTSVGAYWNKQEEMRDPNGTSLLAPGATNNPTGDWAVSPTYSDSTGPNRQRSYRANALITLDPFKWRGAQSDGLWFQSRIPGFEHDRLQILPGQS